MSLSCSAKETHFLSDWLSGRRNARVNYLLIILPKMISFALLLVIGFVCAWRGVLKDEGRSTLSGLLLSLVLPCLIVTLMHERGTTFAKLWNYRRFVLCQILLYFVLAAFGLLTAKLLHLKEGTYQVHSAIMMCGNHAFVVIPLVMALFGPEGGQELIPIGSVTDTILVWTLGIALFTRGVKQQESALKRLGSKFFNPIMFTIVAMLILNSIGVTLPEPVFGVCESIGTISSSLGLLYVGCCIYYMPKGNFSAIKHTFVIALIKLLLVPALFYIVASRFLPNAEAVVLMLTAGAPCMTTSCMIANQYGLDEDYAASTVFVTTICCLITIPLLFIIISMANF